jgi:hypothetical protein
MREVTEAVARPSDTARPYLVFSCLSHGIFRSQQEEEKKVKLREAMKKVWESDKEWFTRNNAFQWLTLFGCFVVIVPPWVLVAWIYFVEMPSNPFFTDLWLRGGGLWTVLLLFCFVFAVVWSFFWVRVFSRWWPF